MSKRILIENYFRNKYPDERYQFKAYHTIEDMFGVKGNNLYVVEFIDFEVAKTLTLARLKKDLEVLETEFKNL